MFGRLMRAVLLTLVVLFVGQPKFLQADDLTGRVLDPQGNVVASANVRLFDRNGGQQRATTTSSDGVFRFEALPAGSYLLEADASHAALVASQAVSLRGDQHVEVALKMAGSRTEVIITASGSPLSVTEIAKAVDVVDSRQLDLRNPLTLSDAIRVLPGVQVQTLEGPGSFTTINTRGLRAVDTAVLIDGMRFQDAGSPQNDVTSFLEDLIPVDTDRIEFLRGAGSSLYGSNAMAGVINIASRPGGKPTHGEFRAEGGGLGLMRGVLSIGGGAGADRFGYSGTVAHLNVTQGVRDRSPYRNTSAQGSAHFRFTPNLSLTGRIWGNTAYLTSTESPTFNAAILANSPSTGRVPAIPLPTDQLELFEKGLPFNAGNATYIPNQIDPDGRRVSSFLNHSVIFQHTVSANTSYRVGYQGVDTRRGQLDGPAGPGSFEPTSTGTSHFNGRTDTIQFQLGQRAGEFNFFTAGYEVERQEYISFNDAPSDKTRTNALSLEQYSHAVYGQDQIRLMDGRLQFMLSGRAQFFTLRQPEFSGGANPYQNVDSIEAPRAYVGDAAVAYFLRRSQTKFRAHVGNSFRSPSAFERFGGSSTGTTLYGDPRLKPERAIAVDAGVDQWLIQSRLEIGATVFYAKLQEMIRFENSLPAGDPFGRFFGYANGGGGIARGVELRGQVTPMRSTNIQASYTYTNSDSNTPTVGTDYYKVLGLAEHAFTLVATQWIGRLHTTFDFSTRSDYEMTFFSGGARRFVFNGASKANLVIGYQIPRGERASVELYSRIENLFNQQTYEDGFIGPKAWAVAGLRVRY